MVFLIKSSISADIGKLVLSKKPLKTLRNCSFVSWRNYCISELYGIVLLSRERTIASAKAQMLLELLQRKRVRLNFATAHQYTKKLNTTYQHPQILSITFHHHPLQLTRGACFNKYTHYENQTRKNIFLSEYSILQKQILLICKVTPKMESYAIGNYIKTIENILPYRVLPFIDKD